MLSGVDSFLLLWVSRHFYLVSHFLLDRVTVARIPLELFNWRNPDWIG